MAIKGTFVCFTNDYRNPEIKRYDNLKLYNAYHKSANINKF